MSEFSEGIERDLRQRAEPAMQDLADDMAGDWKSAVAIQVVGSGKHAIRSKPGEPPRREIGTLQSRIKSEVLESDTAIRASAYTDYRVHGYLETGTERIEPRPSAAPLAERWFAKAVQYIGNAMFGRR